MCVNVGRRELRSVKNVGPKKAVSYIMEIAFRSFRTNKWVIRFSSTDKRIAGSAGRRTRSSSYLNA